MFHQANSNENKILPFSSREEIHLFKESHEIDPKPWQLTAESFNDIARLFSYDDKNFAFDDMRFTLYIFLSRYVFNLFHKMLISRHRSFLRDIPKPKPYDENGSYTTVSDDFLDGKEERIGIADLHSYCGSDRVIEGSFFASSDGESIASVIILSSLIKVIRSHLFSHLVTIFYEKPILTKEGVINEQLAVNLNWFIGSLAEACGDSYIFFSGDEAASLLSSMSLTEDRVKALLSQKDFWYLFIAETLCNIYIWSLTQITMDETQSEIYSPWAFQTGSLRFIENASRAGEGYPMISWDMQYLLPASEWYPTRLPEVIDYTGFRKYRREFEEKLFQKSQLSFTISEEYLSQKVLEERVWFLNRAKRESPESPRLLYIFPAEIGFAEGLKKFFDYLNTPFAQQKFLSAADIGLEILPDFKNLERYFDLFPPSEQLVGDSILLESLRKLGNRDIQEDPFERFQLDEESLKVLEEAAAYLAVDSNQPDNSSDITDEESEE